MCIGIQWGKSEIEAAIFLSIFLPSCNKNQFFFQVLILFAIIVHFWKCLCFAYWFLWNIYQISEMKVQYLFLEALRKKCPYSELFWSAILPHFKAFGLNTERYCISPYSVRMQENAEKMWTRITPNTDIFYAVRFAIIHLNDKFSFSAWARLKKGQTRYKCLLQRFSSGKSWYF